MFILFAVPFIAAVILDAAIAVVVIVTVMLFSTNGWALICLTDSRDRGLASHLSATPTKVRYNPRALARVNMAS